MEPNGKLPDNLYLDFDKYGEVINGDKTFKNIAKELMRGIPVIIGWTPEDEIEHRDILLCFRPRKYGTLQNGLDWNSHLFVAVLGSTEISPAGFLVEWKTNNTKDFEYIQEKMNLKDNEICKKLAELINGILNYME